MCTTKSHTIILPKLLGGCLLPRVTELGCGGAWTGIRQSSFIHSLCTAANQAWSGFWVWASTDITLQVFPALCLVAISEEP